MSKVSMVSMATYCEYGKHGEYGGKRPGGIHLLQATLMPSSMR